MRTNDVQLAIRVPSSLIAAVDALAAEKSRIAGVPVTRAAVLRMLIEQALKRSPRPR